MNQTSNFYYDKKVLVTGGAGFVGSHLVSQLLEKGARVIVPIRLNAVGIPKNLVSVSNDIEIIPMDLEDLETLKFNFKGVDMVMHLAASIGGVQFSSVRQASIFQDNLRPFMKVIEAARQAHVSRFLVCSSACVYPADVAHPTSESEGFKGFPQVTNEGYGMAKRMQEYLGMKYVEEFGMDVRIARPFNGYGPRDDFDLSTSHVIPALIRKVFSADAEIEVWGDGTATRSFIYVDDFARGLLSVAEKGPVGQAVNIGSDHEVSMRDLVNIIVRLCGKEIKIKWNLNKPIGQQRRSCDTSLARASMGFSAEVKLEDGLKKTIGWFKNELSAGRLTLS
ncbi:MAG: NAD-dependent epimerase/dehydratase family protein [Parcubacteria group bacterium]|nr:NAD-dependent epimerase/dehydratase family protein [Parcubacteria group bacterium]